MTKILVLSLSDRQMRQLSEMADFEGKTPEEMITTLITWGFRNYQAEFPDLIAEYEELYGNPTPSDGDDELPY
ncbi:hypothetical protein [Pontivivens ytuae]|uniref:CopG family transcriptional regulator n=1 Tax=Pontivivens ytuae TaxID=2789856 RepID=A0A7S9LT04_9RHOB|nr:hypothetical protein [Pontivivens ytuae]QPH54734.1 hypothetical protein I0K15_02850 [Pontivivens ytuae]